MSTKKLLKAGVPPEMIDALREMIREEVSVALKERDDNMKTRKEPDKEMDVAQKSYNGAAEFVREWADHDTFV